MHTKLQSLPIKIIALIVIYKFLEALGSQLNFSEQAYFQNFSSVNIDSIKPIIKSIFLSTLPLLPLLKKGWGDILDRNFYFFITLLNTILLWFTTFADYNYYFGNSFTLLRATILVLYICTLIKPLFSLSFIVLCVTFLSQYDYPIGLNAVTDKKVLWEFAYLIISFCLLKHLKVLDSAKELTICTIALHVSNYFIPGVYKLFMGAFPGDYIISNKLLNIYYSTKIAGWDLSVLKTLEPVLSFLLEDLKVISNTFIVFIQAGSLLALKSKRALKSFLILFETMHIGIFLLTGIFFWKWIIINLFLIYFVNEIQTLNLKEKIVTSILILASPFFFKPVVLAWWDTPLSWNYTFKINGTRVNKNFFSPYDVMFSQNRFHFTHKEKTVTGVFGTTRNHKALESMNAGKYEQAIINFGKSHWSAKKSEEFKSFLKDYINNYNQLNRNFCEYYRLSSPLYSIYSSQNNPKCDVDIRSIEVYFTRHYLEGGVPIKISEQKIMSLTF